MCSPAAYFCSQETYNHCHDTEAVSTPSAASKHEHITSNNGNEDAKPDFDTLLSEYPMVFSNKLTPWKLVKVGFVLKRRSANPLGRWKRRLLYVVEFHHSLVQVSNSSVTKGINSKSKKSNHSPINEKYRLNIGNGKHKTNGDISINTPRDKTVFCITRPIIKGLDRPTSISKALRPLKQGTKAPGFRYHVKSDTFQPPFKSSCYKVNLLFFVVCFFYFFFFSLV